jgi:hypothetical protein
MQAEEGRDKQEMRSVDVEQHLSWKHLLKVVGHVEVIKLYMFVLEQYATLDAASVHAVASFLRRVTSELNLEPMLYQVRLLLQLRSRIFLTDRGWT